MLYSLISQLIDQYSFLNVFKYLTFRTGLAMFTSMIIVLLIGTPFIKFFSTQQILDPIREDGPTEHIVKKIGTPTMGGVLILLGLFSGILLWGDLSNYHIWFLLYIVISFGLLGAYDDYKKIKLKNFDMIKTDNSKKHIVLGDMLELGKHSKKLHIEIGTSINNTSLKNINVIGKHVKWTFGSLNKSKRGVIIKKKFQIIDLIKDNLDNNDYLMIKGSNSTGLNSLANQIKTGKINAL